MAILKKDKKLTKDQKQAIGILSMGTFLEYFDLMLYVHMAVLLNDLFFSTTDSFSSSLLSSFSFCATFVFRPVGALFIGWIGDNFGRKITVVITSLAMAISCVVMANLPTYDQVGIIASWAVTICRIVQGMSSMGERVGAEVYLTEIIKSHVAYPAVALIGVCASLGLSAALFVADISMSSGFNWRMAFWVGTVVALVGFVARMKLRETQDFLSAKEGLLKYWQTANVKNSPKDFAPDFLQNLYHVNKKTAISFFLIQLAQPVWFYFAYIHCADILKTINCTTEEIIHQNFIISFVDFLVAFGLAYLSAIIHPLKIQKTQLIIFFFFILACPFLLNKVSTGFELMMIQIFIIIFAPSEFPGTPVFYRAFPIFRRFTNACFIYALSRALMYVISSFGIVFLIKYFGNLGLFFLLIPVIIGYGFGLFHFINLKQKEGLEQQN